ncbi:transcriptional regulator [bacterium]|nr:MAG: transcriptional regulator [bacterium]
MGSTNQKVSMKSGRERPSYTADAAAAGIDDALHILEGRWKMKILFHLFDKGTLRFSELERHVSGVSQKMLIQQLKELERDGIVMRTAYPEVPPRVDYRLTEIGQDLCPVLDAILEWAERRAPSAEHQ